MRGLYLMHLLALKCQADLEARKVPAGLKREGDPAGPRPYRWSC